MIRPKSLLPFYFNCTQGTKVSKFVNFFIEFKIDRLIFPTHTGPDQVKIVQKLDLALNPPIMVQITIKTYFYEIPDAIANFTLAWT